MRGKICVVMGGDLSKLVAEKLKVDNAVFHIAAVQEEDPFEPPNVLVFRPDDYLAIMRTAKPDALIVCSGRFDFDVVKEGAKYADVTLSIGKSELRGEGIIRVEVEELESCLDSISKLLQSDD